MTSQRGRNRAHIRWAVLAMIALVPAACGDDASDTGASTSTSAVTSTSASTATTVAAGTGDTHDGGQVEATTTVAVIGDGPEAGETIEVVVVDGSVEGGSKRHSVDVDSAVTISVTSDQADEVHLHGYDISEDVEAGATAAIVFTADIPGVFEVELEGSGLKLAEIEVS